MITAGQIPSSDRLGIFLTAFEFHTGLNFALFNSTLPSGQPDRNPTEEAFVHSWAGPKVFCH